jgi:hypothetical protein
MSLDYSSVILELESDNSRLFKEEVIYQHVNDPIFQEAMCLALDPLVTFGVSDKSVKSSDSDGSGLSWNDFLKVAHSLIDRTLTGNNAIDSIDSLINQATSDQWNNWYRRILLKDLK